MRKYVHPLTVVYVIIATAIILAGCASTETQVETRPAITGYAKCVEPNGTPLYIGYVRGEVRSYYRNTRLVIFETRNGVIVKFPPEYCQFGTLAEK